MRATIFILFVLYSPFAESATLQVENQSRYIAIIVASSGDALCTPNSQALAPCLIAPLSTSAYELSDAQALSATLRFASLPDADNTDIVRLQKHAFKSVSDFTYQPVGPLKYEQVRCETPLNEGISIHIILVDVMDITCSTATDRYVSWVYKRNDVNLKFIVKDLPAKQRKPAR